MYFPYLRCKQFELIALREMATFFQQSNSQISPILEPVRISGDKDLSSTFRSTIKELIEKNINFNIIANPRVGDFKNTDFEIILRFIRDEIKNETSNFQICIIKDNNFNLDHFKSSISSYQLEDVDYSIIHSADTVLNFPVRIKYHIINYKEVSKRYHRNFRGKHTVSLDDYFKAAKANKHYLGRGPSFYSDEFYYYKDDGFFGFSDYLTIGEDYSEAGFAPFAIAIHISYISTSDPHKIYIRHFTSDDNEDRSDVGGKFEQALQKLVDWIASENPPLTAGLEEFQELFDKKHFPGLGYIKKLSIMNHIELTIKNMVK